MNRKMILTGVVSVLAMAAFARPFSPADVPVDAKWVAYVNAADFRDSQLGQFALDSIDENAQRKLDGFKAIFKFDLVHDIDSFLLFGASVQEDSDGVVLVSGSFDEQHLTTLLQMNETYAKTDHNGTVIHNWVDDKNKEKNPDKRTYGAFTANGDILMGDSQKLVAQALDVQSGKAASLSGDSALNLTSFGNASFVAAALEVSDGATLPAKAAMLRQTRNMHVAMREQDGMLHTEIEINTENPEAAFYVDSIVRGMLGMAFLYDEAHPGLAELARGIHVNTLGKRVVIKTAYPVEKVIEMAKDAHKKYK